MRILKFAIGGLIAFFILSVVLKVLFFLAFGALVLGGVAVVGRAIARRHFGGSRFGLHQRQGAWQPFLNTDEHSFDRPFTMSATRPSFQTGQYRIVEIG